MWIKICANTNVDDATLAAELGADAVGFVFAESARRVTAAQVAEIVTKLPDSVEKIGVFASQDATEIAGVVRQTGLTGIQLHGGFDLELARELNAEFGAGVTIIQVLHWRIDEGAQSLTEIAEQMKAIAEEPAVHRVLVDSQTKSATGGTGQSFDWFAARDMFARHLPSNIIAAGGLNPANVAHAIQQLKPWGVDVASGVEASKGRKDAEKLKAFIEAARNY